MKNPLAICYLTLGYFAVAAPFERFSIIATMAMLVCLIVTVFVHFEQQKDSARHSNADDATKQEIEVLRLEVERLREALGSVKSMVALRTISNRE